MLQFNSDFALYVHLVVICIYYIIYTSHFFVIQYTCVLCEEAFSSMFGPAETESNEFFIHCLDHPRDAGVETPSASKRIT